MIKHHLPGIWRDRRGNVGNVTVAYDDGDKIPGHMVVTISWRTGIRGTASVSVNDVGQLERIA